MQSSPAPRLLLERIVLYSNPHLNKVLDGQLFPEACERSSVSARIVLESSKRLTFSIRQQVRRSYFYPMQLRCCSECEQVFNEVEARVSDIVDGMEQRAEDLCSYSFECRDFSPRH